VLANRAVSASAPGRVNLLGEHTDYNDGFVLPIAIGRHTRVTLEPAARFELASPQLDQRSAAYVEGCVKELEARGVAIPPLRFTIESDIPTGVGLSSSAALEVATLRALRRSLGLVLDDVEIARMAQRAEVDHAGVRCGIMDQMACSLAEERRALFLDTRTLERRMVPLPAGCEIAVVDSGVPRSLAATAYNARRKECEQAAAALRVAALRDVAHEQAVDELPPPLRRRARHVVTENRRVLQALEAQSGEAFGALMSDSHRSLRDDFEVSTPEIDRLVDLLDAEPDVFGARLTGAGFGGACVALCRAPGGRQAASRAVARSNAEGLRARVVA
jgi:galactokinase